MSKQHDTVDYTIRGNSMAVDKVVTQLAAASGIPKSTFLRNKLEEIFQNRYDQYAASSSLVAAYDEILARDLGTTIKQVPVDNAMATPDKVALCEILNIKEDRQLENILIDNGKYILQRARQTMLGNGNVPVLTANSLWFALFCELAGSEISQINLAETKIFNPYNTNHGYYKYFENINAIRVNKGMKPVPLREANKETSHCHVRIYKPENYQFGAWHVEITLSKKSGPIMEGIGINYPDIKHRIFIADKASGYSTAVLYDDKDWENGFLIKNGGSHFDLYSNGIPEEENPTPIIEVAEVLADHINNIILKNL
ncbi:MULTISPECIES: hypothetical protein [Morganellaceae]|nr:MULTISPECIES: hypothetical protein [Morganellaceae]ELB3894118.1 hypothetical protein [Morganella morganii]ELB3894632.1 hypothetical protein [Morganella morganii]ELR5110470.1 hypothetical protein [Providencia rettgeri]ELU1438537.1 hypothetical protein [Providencia rettgeri]ELY3857620.1 hypothetical protein [Providencia rettgeri]